jgi:hypothetical protein
LTDEAKRLEREYKKSNNFQFVKENLDLDFAKKNILKVPIDPKT